MATNNEQNSISSTNQGGGITAQNVTINNYSSTSVSNKVSFIKSKRGKWGLAIIGLVTAVLTTYASLSATTQDEIYKFLLVYYQSVEDKDADARDYFTKNINIFYTERNITPERVNIIRRKQDYTDRRYQIDKESIKLRATENGIDYWRFVMNMICYRPSLKKYEKCFAEMEFGIDASNKIASIEQIRYWNLKYTPEKPEW